MQYTLARRLRVLRAERGLTLRDAEQVTGVDKDTLSKIERGVRHPHDTTLAKVAQGYGVPVEELLEEPVLLGKGEASEKAGPSTSPFSDTPEKEADEEQRRTIADAIHDYMLTRVREYEQEVRDPQSFDFRDSTAATEWLSRLQRERRDLARMLHQETPVFNDALNVEGLTLKEIALEAVKLYGLLLAFSRAIRLAEDRIAEMDAADELVKRRLERDSVAADEMVRLANESMAASG